jgi:hypothetical protein
MISQLRETMVRPAFMHHCFAAAALTENNLEVQTVPGRTGCIMQELNRLRHYWEK